VLSCLEGGGIELVIRDRERGELVMGNIMED